MDERQYGQSAAADIHHLIELIVGVVGDDPSAQQGAVEEFHSTFTPLVERIASRFLSSVPSYNLSDLVDEAFAFLTTGLRQDAHGKPYARQSPLRSWLEKPVKGDLHAFVAVCVTNYFRDLSRHRRSKHLEDLLSLEDPELRRLTSVSPHLEDVAEARVILGEVLPKLPAQEIFILHKIYFEGLTYQELARLLGTSEPFIKNLRRRAVGRLKRIVGLKFPDYYLAPTSIEAATSDLFSATEKSPATGQREHASSAEQQAIEQGSVPSDISTYRQETYLSTGGDEVPFASPVVSSMRVSARLKIGGEVAQLPIDPDDIIYLDE